MFIPLVNIVSDVLFTTLDPHHLGNLRLVNKALAKCITKSVQDKSVAAALAKYKHLIVLTENTVRIHSRFGKKVIDLILPHGNGVMADKNTNLFMRLDGRMYWGYADVCPCEINRKIADRSPYVFHNKSGWLFQAGGEVFIKKHSTSKGNLEEIWVFVEYKAGHGWKFTLYFRPYGW
jgi:hypothetical protein